MKPSRVNDQSRPPPLLRLLKALFLALAFAAGGCLVNAQESQQNRNMKQALDAVQLPPTSSAVARHRYIFFATNRKIEEHHPQGSTIGSEEIFLNVPSAELAYGWVEVAYPSNREIADQNYQPNSANQNPRRDFSTWDHYIASGPNELLEIISRFPFKKEARALLYVPGLDNSFHDGAERLTQLALDMGLEGVPLLFSWPSDNIRLVRTVPGLGLTPKTYKETVRILLASRPFLAQTIDDLLGSREFNVLSHSMGTRLTAEALILRDSPSEALAPRLGETNIHLPSLVLAAADMSTKEFSDLRQQLLKRVRRIQIYCSYDNALAWSKWVNESDDRLGFCLKAKETKDLMEGVAFVRVMGKIRDWANHSYYMNSIDILADLKLALITREDAALVPGLSVPNQYKEILLTR